MKNSSLKYVFIIILLLIIISAIMYFFLSNNSNNVGQTNTDILGSRTSVDINVEESNNMINTPPKETEIANYSTEIKDNSSGRLTNIKLTCDIINDTIIEPGETFSFNEIVGQPSSKRGYKEATVIIDGEHEQGIGGGNCQVSSTLYNAVLAASSLSIVERHEHGGSGVTYVPEGKDAAVSYGSLDLKFKNDNNYKIKIKLESDDKTITAKIIKIED